MKAVMYGAGNIGRGFIAKRFFLTGYETVFIDVNESTIEVYSINTETDIVTLCNFRVNRNNTLVTINHMSWCALCSNVGIRIAIPSINL